MSRLLLLSILVLWMCPRDNVQPILRDQGAAVTLFFGLYAAVVMFMAVWSRMLARKVSDGRLGKKLDRYNLGNDLARYFVPLWFGAGMFALGWGEIAGGWLAGLTPAGVSQSSWRSNGEPYWRVLGLLVGTAPALLAWMGLWWAQYPVDRALKEQALVYRANEGLPIHAPPGFGTFFVEHVRQQLLFTLLPIILMVAARDLLALGYLVHARWFGGRPLEPGGGEWVVFPIAVTIFMLAPELLRRVIPTERMPHEWPLRRRLEALCDRADLRCRDILIWRTSSSVGNAMVMGLFSRVRYVFLSDLLLETMSDEEIEAVFAHEIGHIVHRHMWWYAAFVLTLVLLIMGPVYLLLQRIPVLAIQSWMSEDVQRFRGALQAQMVTVFSLAMFIVMFGYLSRRFERQADVYAARTMTATQSQRAVVIRHVNPEVTPETVLAPAVEDAPVVALPTPPPIDVLGPSHVGTHGAAIVGSALQRVARINNIPVAAREWLHGSIHSRMQYLRDLSADPGRTQLFDRYMVRLYCVLVSVIVMLGAWNAVQHLLLPS